MFEWLDERLGLDTTLIVGVLSFMAATIACAVASLRSSLSEARTWLVLACINGVFTIDLFTRGRYRLHNFIDGILMEHGLYQFRILFQLTIVAIFAVILLVGTLLVVKRMTSQSWTVRIAVAMTVIFIGISGVETASLHDIDRVLWARLPYIKVIGVIWAIGAAVITLAAVWRAARGAVPEYSVVGTGRSD